jgi:hypothetical protein
MLIRRIESDPEKGQIITKGAFDRIPAELYLRPASSGSAFTKSLTPFAAVCILSPAIFSRRPCGELFKQQNWQNNQNPS